VSETPGPADDQKTSGKDADKPSVGGFLHNLYEGSKTIFGLLPSLLRILHTLEKHSEIIKLQQGVIDTLRSRLDKLEGREEMLVAKLETAATRVTADFAAKIGRIEGILEGRASRE
jgi:hypothetical protein